MLNLISSRPAIAARSRLRKHPRMQRTLARTMSLGRHRGYEEAFKSAMLACVRKGDCVWDVGANIGLYSELFAEAAGSSGKVFSFEPSPACIAILERRISDAAAGASWEIIPVALSNEDGEAWLTMTAGDTAPSNRLTTREEEATVSVKTARGESLLAAGYRAPSLIKVDVEGFEGEVLDGFGAGLEIPALHAICIEIHFDTLNRRGKPNEPARIVHLLQVAGFTIKWVDISHFIARR